MVSTKHFVAHIKFPTRLALIVDQPAGTGFSYTASNHYLHELPVASEHWIQFLENFYSVFPEYKQVDVCIASLYVNSLFISSLDVPGWRKLRGTVHTLLW